MSDLRPHRVGASIEDLCRACKATRVHTVMVLDGRGRALRVMCDYCRSEHNYRGGGDERGSSVRAASTAPRLTPRVGTASSDLGETGDLGAVAPRLRPAPGAADPAPARAGLGVTSRDGVREPRDGVDQRARHVGRAGAFPLVSERERTGPVTNASESGDDLELVLRRVIREELGLTPVVPADKWRGGEIVLRPGKPGLQEKRWPIESFFHKVVMIRNRLRTLEQQINAAELPEDAKVRLQAYISGCYGSLTSFNLLFAEEEDQFKGAGGE